MANAAEHAGLASEQKGMMPSEITGRRERFLLVSFGSAPSADRSGNRDASRWDGLMTFLTGFRCLERFAMRLSQWTRSRRGEFRHNSGRSAGHEGYSPLRLVRQYF